MKYCSTIFILLCPLHLFSQGLTKKDFKLSLDGYLTSHPDSALAITQEQLLKARKIITNYSWGQLKSFTVYFNSCTASCTTGYTCGGNTICPELIKYFERAGSGTIIIISPVVLNKQNIQIDWSDLVIRVK